jgi:diguanylate cyclase (GGDEF)-like protein/PAS domain S-box-containing protein
LASNVEFDQFQNRLSRLETENQELAETCENLQATQAALEEIIGASNAKLLAAEMQSMELEQVFSSCADPTWVVRQDGIVVRANPAMLRFLGLSDGEVVGRHFQDLLQADTNSGGTRSRHLSGKCKSFHEYEIQIPNDLGEVDHYLVSSSPLITLDGSPGIVAQFKDITLRKKAEAALAEANVTLERLARVDGLTQVFNRRSFDEALAREWGRLIREQAPLSLVLCDIDCFKLYNDHYGHQSGDDCLRKVAQALQSCANRSPDILARYGGEEFVFLLPNTPAGGALGIAEKARCEVEGLGMKHEFSVVKPLVTLSLGVASVIPSADGTPEELVRAADEALYRAKEEGRNRVMAG